MSVNLLLGQKLAITFIMESWINHYHQFCCETFDAAQGRTEALSVADVIDRINGGDCGTTAIAVGTVLNHLATEYSDVTPEIINHAEFFDNFNHAFLKVGDRYYDTFNVDGVESTALLFEADAPNASVENVGVGELFKRYILNDRIGARLIETFCQRWHVPVEANSKVLLDKPFTLSYTTQQWQDNTVSLMGAAAEFRNKPITHTDAAEVLDPEAPNSDLNEALVSMGIQP